MVLWIIVATIYLFIKQVYDSGQCALKKTILCFLSVSEALLLFYVINNNSLCLAKLLLNNYPITLQDDLSSSCHLSSTMNELLERNTGEQKAIMKTFNTPDNINSKTSTHC